MVLEQIGADARVRELFQRSATAGTELARVSFSSHELYRVIVDGPDEDCEASLTGRLRLTDTLPTVGDWVVARPVDTAFVLIEAVLPRRTQFSRRSAGTAFAEQVIAANIDVAMIVCGLDADFNPRRLERYLVLARESGAEPVIVLNKADLCNTIGESIAVVTRIAGGSQIVLLSAIGSVAPVANIVSGWTVALLGSSGAGKSTIANQLLGYQRQATRAVRLDDSRGRHTTTSRMLLPMPGGGAIIDNPGMRELQLWAGKEAVDDTFDDIAFFARRCKFPDCTHKTEPDCAVRDAIGAGRIDPERWSSYQKLQRELRHQLIEQDAHARKIEKSRWKTIHKSLRDHPKYRR
ncbi:MAG TPA: ribosome small subunit-dependent GTPase A [Bryobacteraceae bacterium]|jgi:ribosome biogenesis GTPase